MRAHQHPVGGNCVGTTDSGKGTGHPRQQHDPAATGGDSSDDRWQKLTAASARGENGSDIKPALVPKGEVLGSPWTAGNNPDRHSH